MYITDERDIEAVRDIILSRKYFRNQGAGVESHCARFEKSFAATLGTDFALMVSSGTNALICALSALNLDRDNGDEVIIPAFTFVATAMAVVHAGGIPVLANVDETLSLDAEEVRQLVNKKTKAIIAVHMDGRPCRMSELKSIADEHQVALIEDVAQACGGSFGKSKLGSIGDAGCFSFNVEKILSCGEGGAVVTNSRKIYETSLCVQDGACAFGPTFKDEFKTINPFIGQSMRVSELSGALMQVQLSRLDFILKNLRERQKILKQVFLKRGLSVVSSHDDEGDCGSCVILRFETPEEARSLMLKLMGEKIAAVTQNIRPAHNSWQWLSMLSQEFPQVRYVKTDTFATVEKLMCSLKINTPFEMDLSQTEDFAEKVASLLLTAKN